MDVITYPYLKFSDDAEIRHGWIITSQFHMDAIIYPCPNIKNDYSEQWRLISVPLKSLSTTSLALHLHHAVDGYIVLAWWHWDCHSRHGLQLAGITLGWSNHRLRLPQSQHTVGSCDQWEFPPSFRGHWQSPCKALMPSKCLLLGLSK